MSVEAMIKCDRCSERMIVTSAAMARTEAAAKSWKVAAAGKRPSHTKKDYCPDCKRWVNALKTGTA